MAGKRNITGTLLIVAGIFFALLGPVLVILSRLTERKLLSFEEYAYWLLLFLGLTFLYLAQKRGGERKEPTRR